MTQILSMAPSIIRRHHPPPQQATTTTTAVVVGTIIHGDHDNKKVCYPPKDGGRNNDNDDDDLLLESLRGYPDDAKNTVGSRFYVRPIQRQDRQRIQQLHEQWFPVRYHKEFYDDLCKNSSAAVTETTWSTQHHHHQNVLLMDPRHHHNSIQHPLITRLVIYQPNSQQNVIRPFVTLGPPPHSHNNNNENDNNNYNNNTLDPNNPKRNHMGVVSPKSNNIMTKLSIMDDHYMLPTSSRFQPSSVCSSTSSSSASSTTTSILPPRQHLQSSIPHHPQQQQQQQEQIVACLVGCFLTVPDVIQSQSSHPCHFSSDNNSNNALNVTTIASSLLSTARIHQSQGGDTTLLEQQQNYQGDNHSNRHNNHIDTTTTTTTTINENNHNHSNDDDDSDDDHDPNNPYDGLVTMETVQLLISDPERYPTLFYIMTLGTDVSFRHHGWATQLLQWLFDHIQHYYKHCGVIFLHVLIHNHPAIALYERLGFHRVQEIPNYYTIQGIPHNCYLYAKYFHGNRGHEDSLWYSWLSDYVHSVWNQIKIPSPIYYFYSPRQWWLWWNKTNLIQNNHSNPRRGDLSQRNQPQQPTTTIQENAHDDHPQHHMDYLWDVV